MNYIIVGLVLINLVGMIFLFYWLTQKFKQINIKNQSAKKKSISKSKNDVEEYYLKKIKNVDDKDKIDIVQHCFNRMPYSYKLLDKLWEIAKKSIEEEEDPVRCRIIISEMNNSINLYRNQCNIEELNKSESIREELNNISEKVLQSIGKQEEDVFKSTLEGLEIKINKLIKTKKEDNKIIKEISKIDNSLDKDRLEKYPELFNKYEKLSDKLKSFFKKIDSTRDTDIEPRKIKYNKKAINAHKKAMKKIDDNTGITKGNDYKKGRRLKELVRLVGGWDNNYLFPSTLVYTNTVYNYIFGKLKNKAQLRITKYMVEAKKKKFK